MSKENKIVLSISILTLVIVCLPLFTGNCINGHDIEYHLLRIESLKQGILMGKPFLKVNVLFFGQRGYASSLFYPDFLLYLPAVLRALSVPINTSYHIFIAFCFTAAYGTTYFCAKKISGNSYTALMCAVILTLSTYHLDDVYLRSAVGEYTAFIFLPFLVYGLYDMIFGELEHPVFMGIGFSGVLLCHTNTTFFCIGLYAIAFLFSIKKFIKNKKLFIRLIITAMSVLAVTAFYWVPVLEQILSGGFLYAASEFNLANEMLEVKDILSNNAPAMGIGLFVLCLPRIFLIRTEGEKKSALLRFADWCLLFGLLFSFGATRLFPWARVQDLLSFIQFPWRLFIVSTTLLSFAAAIYMSYYFKEENEKETALLLVLAVMIVGFAGNITNNEQGYYSYSDDYYSYIPFTGNVIGGEWLPSGVTDREALLVNTDTAVDSNGKEYTVERFKNELSVDNLDENADYVDIPFIYYKGYAAEGIDQNTKIQLSVTGEGANGQCRVYLNESSSHIRVFYKGTILQKVSLAVSILLCLLLLVVFFKHKNIIVSKQGTSNRAS